MNTTFEADAIEYLFTCALLVNAELTILRADSVMDALVDFAVEHNVSVIVLGASPQDGADSFADPSLRSAFRMLSWMLCVRPRSIIDIRN